MKKKTMPVAKKAIQELTGDELTILSKFEKSKEFTLLKGLSEKEKYARYQEEFLVASSIEQINFLRGINVGIDFILDSVQRAKEEIESRREKAKVDSED